MRNNFYTHSRKNLIILILTLGSVIAIGPLAIDMYLPAFSEIAKDFNADESLVQLSLTTYFLGIAFGQLLYGPIIDRFGKKPPLIFGLFLFTISSIACCFVDNINQLILLRLFQALGACAGTVVSRSIVRDLFSPQESGRVFSHLMLVMGIAPIVAPMLGSFLLLKFSWKAIFIFLGLFGIFCLLISYLIIPETKGANKDEKISYAFRKYYGILHDKNFVICTLSGGFMMAGLFAYITGSPFTYLEFFGLSSQNYSFLFAINAVGFISASQINARLLKKFSMEKVLEKMFFLPAIAGFILIILGLNEASFWPVTVTIFIYIFSIGAITPNTVALGLANQEVHSGSAAALLGTLQFILAALASFLVSKLHNGGLIPMTFIVGICGIFAFTSYKSFK